jgi:hypothetical protein
MNTKITDHSATVPLSGLEHLKLVSAKDVPALELQEPESLSTQVSQTVFSNPKEFLQVLKDDFNSIAKSGASEFTKDDLQLYSEHGTDEKGRAAAAIAVKHYDQLQRIASGSASANPIKKDDLDEDIKYVTGDIDSIVSRNRSKDTKLALTATAIGQYCARTALKTEKIPALSIGLGVVSLGAIVLDGFLATDIVKQKARTQKVAEENKNMVKSWL